MKETSYTEMNGKRQMTGDLFQILPNSMHPFLVALALHSLWPKIEQKKSAQIVTHF